MLYDCYVEHNHGYIHREHHTASSSSVNHSSLQFFGRIILTGPVVSLHHAHIWAKLIASTESSPGRDNPCPQRQRMAVRSDWHSSYWCMGEHICGFECLLGRFYSACITVHVNKYFDVLVSKFNIDHSLEIQYWTLSAFCRTVSF